MLNFKGEIEQNSGMNLFGKKMVFKYVKDGDEGHIVEFLQDVVRKTNGNLQNKMTLLVLMEEMGG